MKKVTVILRDPGPALPELAIYSADGVLLAAFTLPRATCLAWIEMLARCLARAENVLTPKKEG